MASYNYIPARKFELKKELENEPGLVIDILYIVVEDFVKAYNEIPSGEISLVYPRGGKVDIKGKYFCFIGPLPERKMIYYKDNRVQSALRKNKKSNKKSKTKKSK